MSKYSFLSNANPAYIEELYQKYQKNPDSVDKKWQYFFQGFDFFNDVYQFENESVDVTSLKASNVVTDKEVAVAKLIDAYRLRGHLISNTNPIRDRRPHKSDLDISCFGLSAEDLNQTFESGQDIGLKQATLSQILDRLKTTYCSSIGVEFMYTQNDKLREWLIQQMEPIANVPSYSKEKQLNILSLINKAVNFENFLQTKFVGKKRFSLEGIESLIPSLDSAIKIGSELGASEFVLGMAHRGRLNVLVNVFQKTYENVFSEFDEAQISDERWSGDVKYHLGRSADVTLPSGQSVHLSLVPNPSHLETVNPVVTGITYAKKINRYHGDTEKVIPILIHGDSAFSGQGVNYELSNMSQLDGYNVGGTIHIILNNQVGFTANYSECRSSMYCTDLAKVTESPVFHVNADDPIAVVYVVEMAVKIRQLFKIDVFVDILGYRRYGHNEGDEPRFTQPLLYKSISNHDNVFKILQTRLINEGILTDKDAAEMMTEFKQSLQEKLDITKTKKYKQVVDMFKANWTAFRPSTNDDFVTSIDTSFDRKKLEKIAKQLTVFPTDFNSFKKIEKLFLARQTMFFQEGYVDWGLAEQLAFGSLILDGHNVRLTGQDCQRGTFSHRHSVIKDVETESNYVPLNQLSKKASLEVRNSHLSEYCVMGFEYGYSLAAPKDLVIWEAQFGDFSNGAQIIIDQYLSASERKWQRFSGLTLLLPHGYEGQGPEHSSARFERYLQLCAENNMYVVNVTTPANLFHLFRRQVKNEFRIPLVVMSPKSLLRHPKVVSSIDECVSGEFKEVIDDAKATAKNVKQVICCTGKIYYELLDEAEKLKRKDIAIIRLEQLYPLVSGQLLALKKKYKSAEQWCWVQEEPKNMGAWSFILSHYGQFDWHYIGRAESASPAVGSSKVHQKQQLDILKQAFKFKSKETK